MGLLFQTNNPNRQKLTSDIYLATLKANNYDFKNLAQLKDNLQSAIELEHSTIPPYLCALYSIKDGTNEFASRTIRSIVVEEMLHMIMAANILNAIGGTPAINTKTFIPSYPTKLPKIKESFYVNLEKFSKDSVSTFLKIEKSAGHKPHGGNDFHSIGEFYAAIKESLIQLDKSTKGGIFKGDAKRQVTSEQYYGSGGKLIPVYNLADALVAIEEIVGQGEGIDDTIEDPDHILFGEGVEYAHYFKFNEIYHGRKYIPTDKANENPSGPEVSVAWHEVYPMQLNPKMNKYKKGTEIWEKTYEFNKTYMTLLNNIHDACNGKPEMLMQGIALMYDLKYKALELMKIPVGDNGETAGPSFEYIKI
jgi:rubrerythrin